MVDGVPVPWEALHHPLAELAGAAALTDLVLDRQLALEMSRRGLALTPQMVEGERALTAESLAAGDEGARLLEDVRRARGLGPERYESFLRRNAMLRLLASGSGDVTEEMARQRYEVRYGRKVRARVITVATQGEAAAIRAEVTGGGDVRLRFAEAAVMRSTDESAARGGLVEPISPADPAYETVVRQTLARMAPGELSPVVALENGFGLFLVEEVVPPSGPVFESARADIERELRRRQERIAMDALARELLASARVTVFDPSLGWSWSGARTGP